MRPIPLLAAGIACGLLGAALAAAGQLYKHTDDKGNVVYSDRPGKGGDVPQKTQRPNAASPEATRQYEMERRELLRKRQEEAVRARQLREQQERSSRPTQGPGPSYVRRTDPNLPDSPPPSTERRDYYRR
jgi:hypothetical protein